MRLRLAGLLLVLGVIGLLLWRAELFTVSRPGDRPVPLARVTREPVPAFDVSLPVVPIGVERLTPGGGALLVHYWAPWERDSRAQVLALDSLVRTLPPGGAHVVVVCFDPFPSVARYAARLRLTVPVMLDLRRALQAALPCPSIPYTWLLDTRGRVLARQPGEVDWLAAETRALLLEAGRATAADTTAALSLAPESARPRRIAPTGPGSHARAQARTVSARGRTNQGASSAYPPNSTAL
jgi:hypothetical protein